MSTSRAAGLISSIPTLIRCDLIWLSAAESREPFHADADNCCGKTSAVSSGFIFKLRRSFFNR